MGYFLPRGDRGSHRYGRACVPRGVEAPGKGGTVPGDVTNQQQGNLGAQDMEFKERKTLSSFPAFFCRKKGNSFYFLKRNPTLFLHFCYPLLVLLFALEKKNLIPHCTKKNVGAGSSLLTSFLFPAYLFF